MEYNIPADIDKQDDPQHLFKTTTLLCAMQGKLWGLVQCLQSSSAAGARTRALAAADAQGRTALILAAMNNGFAVVQYLLLQGVDVNAADSKGFTALHAAAAAGHLIVVLILLGARADPQLHAAGASGVTALHLAAKSGHTDAMLQLLRAGADVNAVDAGGRTALHYAVAGGRPAVKLLLQWGAHINAQDSYGATALFVLVDELTTHIDILQLLLSSGADGTLPTTYGLTALDSAARHLQAEVMQCLLAHYGRGLSGAAVVSALQEAEEPDEDCVVGGQRQHAVLGMLHSMLMAPEE